MVSGCGGVEEWREWRSGGVEEGVEEGVMRWRRECVDSRVEEGVRSQEGVQSRGCVDSGVEERTPAAPSSTVVSISARRWPSKS